MPLFFLLELQFDVDARRKIEPLKRVHRLRRRVDDVEQPLVCAHLEVLARVLVLVRRPDDRVDRTLRGERDRTVDACARTSHRLDDLLCALVDDLVVVGLQPDPNLHSGCQVLSSLNVLVFFSKCLFIPLRDRRDDRWDPARVPRAGVTTYSVIFTTRPAPTVRPPSRIALSLIHISEPTR